MVVHFVVSLQVEYVVLLIPIVEHEKWAVEALARLALQERGVGALVH